MDQTLRFEAQVTACRDALDDLRRALYAADSQLRRDPSRVATTDLAKVSELAHTLSAMLGLFTIPSR
jgi:arylamine N-acetyltransferase